MLTVNPFGWIALATCLIASYFAACHIALKNFSRTRLAELLNERGKAQRLEPFLAQLNDLQLMTGTLRTCLNLVVLLTILFFVDEKFTTHAWSDINRYLLAFAISGILVSVFIVAIPLSWARYHCEGLLARSVLLLETMRWFFHPLTSTLHLLDPIVRRLSGGNLVDDNNDLSDEVLSVVEERDDEGHVDENQKDMIEAVFEFGSTTVGEIMTPRTDVKGIDASAALPDIRKLIISDGHSRYPVYDESLDNVEGVLYAKDMLRFIGKNDQDGFNVKQVLRKAIMVPETKPVRALLSEFKAKKVHIAIVLDEYGGTAGLVTVEDIVEEIVGDIHDEHELSTEDPTIRRIDPTITDVDARVHVDDLNDELNVRMPEDEDYETVGGFVFSTLGHIPEIGETFEFDNLRFTVTDAERTKVNRVRIEVLGRPSSGNDNGK